MTPVGHSIMGVTIALTVLPPDARIRTKLGVMLSFIVLANVPDVRLHNWGHHRYDISHSVFVTLAIIAAVSAAVLLCHPLRRKIGGWTIVAGGVVAWLSHLLLDSFYNHGQGIAIFWPFSRARLILPIPWFEVTTTQLPGFTPQAFRVWTIELLCYGAVFVIVLGVRTLVIRWRRQFYS